MLGQEQMDITTYTTATLGLTESPRDNQMDLKPLGGHTVGVGGKGGIQPANTTLLQSFQQTGIPLYKLPSVFLYNISIPT